MLTSTCLIANTSHLLKALSHFKKAAEQGDRNAHFYLGMMNLEGLVSAAVLFWPGRGRNALCFPLGCTEVQYSMQLAAATAINVACMLRSPNAVIGCCRVRFWVEIVQARDMRWHVLYMCALSPLLLMYAGFGLSSSAGRSKQGASPMFDHALTMVGPGSKVHGQYRLTFGTAMFDPV